MRSTIRQYRTHAFLLGILASLGVLAAEPLTSQYAGQETRSIKALSHEETAALLSGQGSGFAKAAELNGYPGPAHVLELATRLGLDSDQLAATQALMSAHRRRAQRIGAELVAAERNLDALFAERQARTASVDQATQKVVGMVQLLRTLGEGRLDQAKEMNGQLQQIEGEADDYALELLGQLYSGRYEPIKVLALRDLYDLLEKVIDRCRDAGNVITHIVLKNS